LSSAIAKLIARYFGTGLDLRVQSFNLLGFAGVAAGVIVAVVSILNGVDFPNIAMNLAASALAFLLLRLTMKKRLSYHAGSWIVIAAVFMLAFPAMFFTAGGYRSGMPCFFVFSIIYTAIMLEKRERLAAIAAELALYVACCVLAYRYPQTVAWFQSESDYLADIIMGIIASSGLLTAVVLLHIRMYRARQRQVDELNGELAERNAALTRVDRMKTDFLAAVAHEIRTPLDFIVAGCQDTVDILGETPVSTGEIISNQEKMKQRAIRIDAIVMDLMDTVAIEQGRLPLSLGSIDLAALLKSACDAALEKGDNNNNRLSCRLPDGLPPITADAARIEQVITNLVSNAVRHTRNGEIKISLTRAGGVQTVSVEDSGEGMDKELSEAVMKGYAPSTKGDYWRHGIGLSLCRQIVMSHGGEIRIDSERGRGTRVTFALKEAPEASDREPITPSEESGNGERSPTAPSEESYNG
jgi:signal transduction histidine kinase